MLCSSSLSHSSSPLSLVSSSSSSLPLPFTSSALILLLYERNVSRVTTSEEQESERETLAEYCSQGSAVSDLERTQADLNFCTVAMRHLLLWLLVLFQLCALSSSSPQEASVSFHVAWAQCVNDTMSRYFGHV